MRESIKRWVLALSFVCCPSLVYALGNDSIISIIQDAQPSLVTITSENVGLYGGQEGLVKDPSGRIFVAKSVAVARYSRQGAGVIIDPSGIIATNAHAVAQAGRVNIVLNDGRNFEGEVISSLLDDDIALIRIKTGAALQPLTLANEDEIKMGIAVYYVGSAQAHKGSMCEGRIVSLGTKTNNATPNKVELKMLRINFDVAYGDSGGPVIDRNGKLIGLIMAGSNQGNVCLAVPATKVAELLKRALAK